ncbi:unnamed protein product [Rodentolepis nana]|uniref:Gustatory receptor n=1 Tax=Rodentolepis nana TaxID=102285 RepID=A0A0R3TC54_RODNA|nr:unnamed protein product [Rodentolepis nana]
MAILYAEINNGPQLEGTVDELFEIHLFTFRTSANSSNVLEKIAIKQIHHISFPHIPIQGTFGFHVTRLIFSIITLCLQFLNIYRTVWWLGRPGVKYPIDIDNIDFHLVYYILLMLLISPFYEAFQNIYWRSKSSFRSSFCLLTGIIGFILWCLVQFHMIMRINYDSFLFTHPYFGVLLVIYQPMIFLFVYYYESARYICRLAMEEAKSVNFKERLNFITNQVKAAFHSLLSLRSKLSVKQFISWDEARSKPGSLTYKVPRYSPFMPIRYATVQHPAFSYTATFYTLQTTPKQQHLVVLRHNCARCCPATSENAAQVVRDEVDALSADFNARLFDTIMGTAALTFYCTILPCFFVKVSCTALFFTFEFLAHYRGLPGVKS